VPTKCIHFLRHYHITSHFKVLQLSVFRILHRHKHSPTIRAVLLLQEAPRAQTATNVQLQYVSKHVMGKTHRKVCAIHKYPVSMPHERTKHRPAEEHSITSSVLQKNIIQKFPQFFRASWYYQVLYLSNWMHNSVALKNVKTYIKSAPTCFGLTTIIRELIV
jgi:hypothetical protein